MEKEFNIYPNRMNLFFLNKAETITVQSITGSILYYARAVDPTMLPALNDIATQQAKPTQKTLR